MNNCTVFVGSDTIQCSAAPESLQPVPARLIYRKIYIDISSYLIHLSTNQSLNTLPYRSFYVIPISCLYVYIDKLSTNWASVNYAKKLHNMFTGISTYYALHFPHYACVILQCMLYYSQ